MRLVLDTNIYIAATLNRDGFSAKIIDIIAKDKSFTPLTSEEILLELEQKFKNKFGWPKESIEEVVNRIRRVTETVLIVETISVITRDPADNKILECAVSGKADLIVTMDQDLIKLKTFNGIGIVHPKTLAWTFPKYFRKINS